MIAAAGLAAAVACGRDPDLAAGNLPAVGRGPAAATLLQVPRAGGVPRLYRVPTLESSSWKVQDKLPPLERLVGSDPDQGVVYFLDRKHNVVGIDLETHRVRTYTEQVRNAVVGPDGSLFTIDTGEVVTQLVRRTPVRFRSKLQGTPLELSATMNGSLLARIGGKAPALEVLGPDQAPTTTPIAAGDMVESFWGDLVAVAGGGKVTVYQIQGKEKPRTLDVDEAKAAMFSPSGHRLYVVRESGALVIFDRYSWDKLEEVDLPGPAVGLLGDLYGQWVLIRPALGDSAWVFDVGHGHLAGTAPAHWEGNLPQVVSPSTLLTRQGDSLVALDLGTRGFPRRGAVAGAEADLFIPLAWRPEQDEPIPAESDSAVLAAAADSAKGGATVYLQVSSSQNPAWADELSQRLRAAGLPATVLRPRRSDEPHRVVVGPYPTREQAESAGRKLGMPSFVVTAQDQPAH
jgi:sporulation related protein